MFLKIVLFRYLALSMQFNLKLRFKVVSTFAKIETLNTGNGVLKVSNKTKLGIKHK